MFIMGQETDDYVLWWAEAIFMLFSGEMWTPFSFILGGVITLELQLLIRHL